MLSSRKAMEHSLPLPDWSNPEGLEQYKEMHVLVNGWFGPELRKVDSFFATSVWRPPKEVFGSGYTPKPVIPELLSPVPVEMMTIQELNDAFGWK